MNLDDDKILEIFNEYIENPKMQYAILLDGDWGSGKTYFIKNKFVKDNKNILYISLYGIKNREDLDKKIYYKILENNMPAKITQSNGMQKGIMVAKKTGSAIFNITNDFIKNVFKIDISKIKNISGSEIISLFKNISDYIIVFDDLERCEIPINEILGYINDYVEHRNVKCIIVANEQEINKISYDNNYELKVLSCLKNDIDYGDEQNNTIEKEKSKTININKIKDRIFNLYEGNKKYTVVKEKLIGITIKYIPNINNIYDQLILEYKQQNKKLYEFLQKNKQNCIDTLELNNCNNIRTLIFILDRFEGIFKEIHALNIDKESIIMNLVFENVVFSSVGIKKGIDTRKKLSGSMCSSDITLSKDLRQNYISFYTAFNFVDDYILDGNIDKEKILECINYYFSINYEEMEDNDPYNKIKIYWELEDQEIKDTIQQILVNIQNEKYNYQLFPQIIYKLSCIENLNFEKEKIQNIIEEMGKYVEKKSIDFIDFHVFAESEQIYKIYNEHVKYIKNKIKINAKTQHANSLKEIIESDDWGINLYNYIIEYKNQFLDNRSFLNEFNVTDIVKKINEANSKNIYSFKYCINEIYEFSDLKSYYSIDLKNIEELINGLKGLDETKFGVMKKDAIKYLIKFLNQIKNELEK